MADIYGGPGDEMIDGTAGADKLGGGGGDDLIRGYEGDDVLIGGPGKDVMLGGSGDDTYYVDDNSWDLIGEYAGGGTDRVVADWSFSLAPDTEIEVLELARRTYSPPDSATLTGSDFANAIYGSYGRDVLNGQGGDDFLAGFDGNDVLNGGTGADVMLGGNGTDVYYVDDPGDYVYDSGTDTPQVSTFFDRVATTVSFALSNDSGIELLEVLDPYSSMAIDLTGSSTTKYVNGNNGANRLDGGGSAAFLNGYGGNDVLIGYRDARMTGGAGDDVFYLTASFRPLGSPIVHQVYEQAGDGYDRVSTAVSFVNFHDIEVVEVTSVYSTEVIDLSGNAIAEIFRGNFGANTLSGAGGSDTLYGLGGNDTLDGGSGSDTLFGGTGDDTFLVDAEGDRVLEFVGEGADRVVASVSYELENGYEIERLETDNAAGLVERNLVGNEFGQTIVGNAEHNGIAGRGGNDVLTGGGRSDDFIFDSVLGPGNVDTITDFAGDRIVLDDAVFGAFAGGQVAAGNLLTGTAAADADDYLVYDAATGALYYDPDGSGAAAQVQFAILAGHPALAAGDFLVI